DPRPGLPGSPTHPAGPVATFGQRVPAFLIDLLVNLVGFVPIVAGSVALSVLPWASSGSVAQGTDEVSPMLAAANGAAMLTVLVGVLTMFAVPFWNRIIRQGRTGQSVGKQVAGLTLVDHHHGHPIGMGRVLLREFVHIVVNQIFWFSFLWASWDPNRQTVGDKAARSTVVVLPRTSSPAPAAP
ncbi:MAG: RDD family protein, partial [Dermatophilaceae bacterium]